MNPISEVIGHAGVVLDMDAVDKPSVLGGIAKLLAIRTHVPVCDIEDALVLREQLGSTGMGHGVAIPHARMPQCVVEAAVFVRTKQPIPFDAPDRQPVSLFLALVVPKQANERHLQMLASAAGMFGDAAFRRALRGAQSPGEVQELLAAWPDSPA